jgi:hypothetical protein
MTALSSKQRLRHQELGELLRFALVEARELSNGYDFEFSHDPKIYGALAEITPLEHACCPFFTIAIRLEHSKLFWRLTGSEGVKKFIRMEFAVWFK